MNQNENERDDADDLPPGIIRSRESLPSVGSPLPPSLSPADGGRGGGNPSVQPLDSPDRKRLPAPLPPSAGEREGGRGPTQRITAIEEQERRKGRVSVFVDGKFAIGLFAEVSAALGLRVGQAITPERLEEIARAETLRRAKEDAYRLLSFRARSEKEIADRLRRKGYEDDVIAAVAESLKGQGFVNDEAFAASWVESRGRTRGRRALAFELRQKGVASETARETLDEAKGDEAERESARVAAVKKVGERPADQSREARARLAAFLQRRGFDWQAIRPVLTELYSPSEDETEDG